MSALQKTGAQVKWLFLVSQKPFSRSDFTNPDRFSTNFTAVFRHVDGAGRHQPSHRVTGTMHPSL
jgi:hypothetical protein